MKKNDHAKPIRTKQATERGLLYALAVIAFASALLAEGSSILHGVSG